MAGSSALAWLLAVSACGGDGDTRDAGAERVDASDAARIDAATPPRYDAALPPEEPGIDHCDGIYAACDPERGCATGECIHFGLEEYRCLPPAGGGCTPDGCGPCGTCLPAWPSTGSVRVDVCARSCTRSVADNGECLDGNECDLGEAFCRPGCTPGVIGDEACGRRFPGGVASCEAATFRCRHAGTAGAEAAASCITHTDCEPDGRCIDGEDWPGGYCTKLGCDVPGNGCAGDGACYERRLVAPMCVAPCMLASGGGTYAGEWITDTGGCRDGYVCIWDGVHAAGEVNGGCLPGELNDVAMPNVGAACETSATCHSPFGLGYCSSLSDDGYCTISDCLAPGVPHGVCGPGARCVDADGTAGDVTLCLDNCASPADCPPDLGCTAFPTLASPLVCVGCTSHADCRPGRHCFADAGFLGRCL